MSLLWHRMFDYKVLDAIFLKVDKNLGSMVGQIVRPGKKMYTLSFDTLEIYNPRIYPAELFSNNLKLFALDAQNSGD